MVDLDVAKGIEVHADDVLALDEIRRYDRIFHAHGEVVAHAEEGKVQVVVLADQLHVAKQRCITGVVEGFALRFEDHSCRMAAIAAVGHAAGVHRVGEFHRTKVKFILAAVVHGVVVLDALLPEPAHHLEGRDKLGTRPLGDGLDVRDMVAMTMRQDDVISRNFVDVDR